MVRYKKFLYIIFLILYTLLFYILLILGRKDHAYAITISNTLQTLASIITLPILIMTSKKSPYPRKHFWMLLSVGCGSYLIFQIIWDYYEVILGINNPVFGYSMFFWILHGMAYISAIFFITHEKKNTSWLLYLTIDILTFMCLFIATSITYVFRPVFLQMHNYNLFSIFEYTIYPVGDLICLFISAGLFLSLSRDDSERKYLANISLAFFIMSIVNLSYSFLCISKSYLTGSLIDPLWSLYILTIGLSGIEYMNLTDAKKNQAARAKKKNNYSTSSVSILPTVSVIALFILFLLKPNKIIMVCFDISIILIMLRHIIVIFQNKKLILSLTELNSNLELKIATRTKALSNIAFHDQLTGLANRRLFERSLKNSIRLAKKNKETFALLFLDLDRFKVINDTLGHYVGDSLLKEISTRLNSSLDSNCFISRQGGDEFAIIVKNINCDGMIEEICKKILCSLSRPILLNNHSTYITCSIGIAIYPDHGKNFETLMKHADAAMYCSKDAGKNTYEFYDCSIDEANSKKLLIEQELRNAIINNEFELYYQPQINMLTEKITGAEALIRWVHPVHGIISPADFIPIAEETGLIDNIGRWVLKTACNQAREWQDKGFMHFKIGINVSPHQFKQENFVLTVNKTLETSNLSPQYLDLEITETMAIENTTDAIGKLQSLKKLGVKISIDDFGTGYTSLSYLTKFPIDTLKIDKSFVDNINNDTTSKTIVSSIIAVSKNLSINVIAEGVENKEQWEFLKSQNCPQIQGYLFSKPLSVDKFEKLLEVNSL